MKKYRGLSSLSTQVFSKNDEKNIIYLNESNINFFVHFFPQSVFVSFSTGVFLHAEAPPPHCILRVHRVLYDGHAPVG